MVKILSHFGDMCGGVHRGLFHPIGGLTCGFPCIFLANFHIHLRPCVCSGGWEVTEVFGSS